MCIVPHLAISTPREKQCQIEGGDIIPSLKFQVDCPPPLPTPITTILTTTRYKRQLDLTEYAANKKRDPLQLTLMDQKWTLPHKHHARKQAQTHH